MNPEKMINNLETENQEVEQETETKNEYDQKAPDGEVKNFRKEIEGKIKDKAGELEISEEELIELADLDLESLGAEKLKELNLKQGELGSIRDSIDQAINEFQKDEKTGGILEKAPSSIDKMLELVRKHKKVVSVGELALYLSSFGSPVLSALAGDDAKVEIEGEEISLKDISSPEELALKIYKSMGGKEISPDLVNFLGYGYLPENYQDYVTPEDSKIKECSEKIKIKFILSPANPMSKFGTVEFPSEIKFEYKTDDDLLKGEDVWQKPSEYLEKGAVGDCEDYALAMSSIFEARGYETRVICGYMSFEEAPTEGHWNMEVFYEGKYFVMDVNKPGEIIERDYFNQKLEKYDKEWKCLGMFGKDVKLSVYEENWKDVTDDNNMPKEKTSKTKDQSDFIKQKQLYQMLTTYDPKQYEREHDTRKIKLRKKKIKNKK